MVESHAREAKIAIVGASGGTHVGESLRRAGESSGLSVLFFDTARAFAGPALVQSFAWRFADRRPLRLGRFCDDVIDACTAARLDALIATGAAPLTADALERLRAIGIVCINYSTDDPWNRALNSAWHKRALPHYDFVFTPRRSTLEDFRQLGCADVHYLPFGYDEILFAPPEGLPDAPQHDVLFVGGADKTRASFIAKFLEAGSPITLVGGYWERFSETRPFTLGVKSPQELRALTAKAKVNLCLVRRANRDGHVMRSFEIAAIGGCMLAEDTPEHREIFGEDGEAVAYFRAPREAAERARTLLADPRERERLAAAIRLRIANGGHTYRERLISMLDAAKHPRQHSVSAAKVTAP